MKRILAAALVMLSPLLTPQAIAAAPVEARLWIPHDHVLPGVPFDLVVTYTNVSDRAISIDGALATLVVTFADGATTVMHSPERNDQSSFGFPHGPARLKPGQSVQQPMGWDHGSIPNWFIYESFSGPGTYGIALDLRIVDQYNDPIASLRTPAVTLTVIEPAGIDAALWKRMQDVSSGKWADISFNANNRDYAALADEIVQLHPTSGYYPYILALRALMRADKKHIPPLLEAAERFQASPAYSYLLAAAGNCARYAGAVAAREGQAIEAEKYFALAETKYLEALATKTGVVVRLSSEGGLRELTWRRERLKKPAR